MSRSRFQLRVRICGLADRRASSPDVSMLERRRCEHEVASVGGDEGCGNGGWEARLVAEVSSSGTSGACCRPTEGEISVRSRTSWTWRLER